VPAGARPCGRDDALRQGRRLTFADQGALELRDGAEHLHRHLAGRAGQIDPAQREAVDPHAHAGSKGPRA
jgi:hypothetical protein